jgi:hypothetical protein
MDQAELKADLIEVTVSGTFKTEHVFNTQGGILGTLTVRGSKREGKFLGADESALDFKKPSIWKDRYELLEGNSTIGKAHPPKKLKRTYQIDFTGEIYQLARGGSKLRSWTLTNTRGQGICEVLPRGGLKRGAFIKIGSDIPLNLLVFVYCLVIKRWQEESTAAAV